MRILGFDVIIDVYEDKRNSRLHANPAEDTH